MVEKLSAAAAGREHELSALFVGHCSRDYELPFYWRVTIN